MDEIIVAGEPCFVIRARARKLSSPPILRFKSFQCNSTFIFAFDSTA
jgi:hypothetical protein